MYRGIPFLLLSCLLAFAPSSAFAEKFSADFFVNHCKQNCASVESGGIPYFASYYDPQYKQLPNGNFAYDHRCLCGNAEMQSHLWKCTSSNAEFNNPNKELVDYALVSKASGEQCRSQTSAFSPYFVARENLEKRLKVGQYKETDPHGHKPQVKCADRQMCKNAVNVFDAYEVRNMAQNGNASGKLYCFCGAKNMDSKDWSCPYAPTDANGDFKGTSVTNSTPSPSGGCTMKNERYLAAFNNRYDQDRLKTAEGKKEKAEKDALAKKQADDKAAADKIAATKKQEEFTKKQEELAVQKKLHDATHPLDKVAGKDPSAKGNSEIARTRSGAAPGGDGDSLDDADPTLKSFSPTRATSKTVTTTDDGKGHRKTETHETVSESDPGAPSIADASAKGADGSGGGSGDSISGSSGNNDKLAKNGKPSLPSSPTNRPGSSSSDSASNSAKKGGGVHVKAGKCSGIVKAALSDFILAEYKAKHHKSNPTVQELNAFTAEPGAARDISDKKDELEDQYDCEDGSSTADFYDGTGEVLQLSSQVGAGVAAGLASSTVIDASSTAEGQANIQATAQRSMGEALVTAGEIQLTTAAAHALIAARAIGAARGWSNDTDAAKLHQKQATEVVEEDERSQEQARLAKGEKKQGVETFSKAGIGQAIDAPDTTHDVGDANKAGEDELENAVTAAGEVRDKFKATRNKALVNTLLNGSQGAIKYFQGKKLIEDAGKLNAVAPTTPLTAPELTNVATDDGSPQVFNPNSNSNESAISASPVDDGSGGAGGGDSAPPIFGNSHNPGGLKDKPSGGNGGLASIPTSSGGGGGPPGLAGGGSPAGAAKAPGADDRGESFAGGGSRFVDAGVGSGTAFGAGAGAGKANNSTGDMDLANMLKQLLPGQKEDDRKIASILEFDKNKQGTVGPGDQDDGTILGKNSNLFLRASSTTMNYFKKGLLK